MTPVEVMLWALAALVVGVVLFFLAAAIYSFSEAIKDSHKALSFRDKRDKQ